MNSHTNSGFTLLELIITMAVAGVVLAIAGPDFVNLIRNNDAVTEINELASALNLARSEAIGRGVEVTVVPLAGGDWTTGWQVGVDLDGDNVFPEAGEPILRTYPSVNAITFTASPARLEYRPTGEVNVLANFTMLPHQCDNEFNAQRTLSVALAGYADLSKQACPP